MTNLPIRGEPDSLDNVAVTREEFRVGIGQLLEYMAGALGGISSTYNNQAVDPEAVILQGAPTLSMGAVPTLSDDSRRLAPTQWVRDYLTDLLTSGVTLGALNGGQLAGIRNRIINGDMRFDQYNNASPVTVTAGLANVLYRIDRWFSYSLGGDPTCQRVTIAGSQVDPFRLRHTGAASVSAIGVGQRIEALNCRDLAGGKATLSFWTSNSLLTTLDWTISYANTNDAFGLLAAPTKTLIATGSVAISSTYTRYDIEVDIPAAATTGIEILLIVGAQTSGTWDLGRVQLETGTEPTPFEQRDSATEFSMCQRYFEVNNFSFVQYATASAPFSMWMSYSTQKRATPTIGFRLVDYANASSGSVSAITTDGVQIFAAATASGTATMSGTMTSQAEL